MAESGPYHTGEQNLYPAGYSGGDLPHVRFQFKCFFANYKEVL